MTYNPKNAIVDVLGLTSAIPLAANYTLTGAIALFDTTSALRASLYTNTNGNGMTALRAGSLGAAATWVVNLFAAYSFVPNMQYPEIGVCVSTGTTTGDTAYGHAVFGAGSYAAGVHQVRFHPAVGGARLAVNSEYTSGANTRTLFHRLVADGTNLHYQVSQTGRQWTDLFVEATPASLTNWGFFVGNEFNAGGTTWCQAEIYRSDLTTLTLPQVSIASSTNATPIVVTATAHGLSNGDLVSIHGHSTNTNANNGTTVSGVGSTATSAWPIQVLSANTFSLIGSTGNGVGGATGTATLISR